MDMSTIEKAILDYASLNKAFTIHEITNIVAPGTPYATTVWRLSIMTRQGLLDRIGRGKYQRAQKARFESHIDEILLRKGKNLKKAFPYTAYCIWNIGELASFSRHQFGTSYDILEVDKESVDSVVEMLNDKNELYMTEKVLEIVNNNIITNKRVTVVKALIQEAPLATKNGIYIPSLEKLIVDLYCGGPALSFLEGIETETIIDTLLARYTVNFDTLLRYATRRGKKKEIANSNFWQK
jgi:hypothetical protein